MRLLAALAFLITSTAHAAPDYGSFSASFDGAAATGNIYLPPRVVGYKDFYGKACPDKSKPISGAPPAGRPVQLAITGAFKTVEGMTDIYIQLGGYTPEELAKTPLTITPSPKRLMCPEKHLLMQLLTPQSGFEMGKGELVLESVDFASGKVKGRFEFSGFKTNLMTNQKGAATAVTKGQFEARIGN